MGGPFQAQAAESSAQHEIPRALRERVIHEQEHPARASHGKPQIGHERFRNMTRTRAGSPRTACGWEHARYHLQDLTGKVHGYPQALFESQDKVLSTCVCMLSCCPVLRGSDGGPPVDPGQGLLLLPFLSLGHRCQWLHCWHDLVSQIGATDIYFFLSKQLKRRRGNPTGFIWVMASCCRMLTAATRKAKAPETPISLLTTISSEISVLTFTQLCFDLKKCIGPVL